VPVAGEASPEGAVVDGSVLSARETGARGFMSYVPQETHMCPRELYVIPDNTDEDEGAWIQPRSVEGIVFDAIAEATDYGPDDLDPLAEYVDQAALASLFDDTDDASELTFAVEEYDVTLHRSGDVEIDES
jgi:hypothetical protein